MQVVEDRTRRLSRAERLVHMILGGTTGAYMALVAYHALTEWIGAPTRTAIHISRRRVADSDYLRGERDDLCSTRSAGFAPIARGRHTFVAHAFWTRAEPDDLDRATLRFAISSSSKHDVIDCTERKLGLGSKRGLRLDFSQILLNGILQRCKRQTPFALQCRIARAHRNLPQRRTGDRVHQPCIKPSGFRNHLRKSRPTDCAVIGQMP